MNNCLKGRDRNQVMTIMWPVVNKYMLTRSTITSSYATQGYQANVTENEEVDTSSQTVCDLIFGCIVYQWNKNKKHNRVDIQGQKRSNGGGGIYLVQSF